MRTTRNRLTHARAGLAAVIVAAAAPAAAEQPVRSGGGEIAAPRPAGPGWTCEPASRTGEGFRLSEIRCSRAAGAADVRLYAKDYAGPSETVGAICARDWRAYYRGTLQEVSRLQARTVRLRGKRVCAVDAEGTSTAGERLRIREWYAVAPGHVLLVTAAGPSDAMRASAAVVAKWRDGVRFRPAPRSPGADPGAYSPSPRIR